jgi:hypothetical protein
MSTTADDRGQARREERDNEQPGHPVDRAMRSAVGRESTTFGFSIMVTVGFGVLQSRQGTPTIGDLFLYAIGAVSRSACWRRGCRAASGDPCPSTTRRSSPRARR